MKSRLSVKWLRGLQPLLKGRMITIMMIVFVLTFGVGSVRADIPPTGSMITLTAVNGLYVSAANNGNILIANQQTAGDDETFEVVDAGSGMVGLKCLGNGQFVCAESSGHDALTANRNNIGVWETFTIKQSGDKIGFVAYINGKYVCAENNGEKPLIANRTRLRSYEQFSYTIVGGSDPETDTGPLTTGDVIALKAVNNRYVSASDAGNVLIADQSGISNYQRFEVVNAGNGLVGFKCLGNSKFVCAEGGGDQPLEATRGRIGSWEKFALLDLGGNEIGIKAAINNLYVCARDGGNSSLLADRSSVGSWETFLWTRDEGDPDEGDDDGGTGDNSVLPDDATLVKPDTKGPVITPIFGFNWTNGRISDWLETYNDPRWEWPIYNHEKVDGKTLSEKNIMNRDTPQYWDMFVDELLLSRVDVISFHGRGPIVGDMKATHLSKFIDACDRAGVRDQFNVAMWDDTGMHGNNIAALGLGSKLDCAKKEHRDYLYEQVYKVWFDTLPRAMWYTTKDGHPIISSWNFTDDDFTNHGKAREMLEYCADRFKKDFGVRPKWILQQNWFEKDSDIKNCGDVLGKHDWFRPNSDNLHRYREFNGYKAGVVAPGFTGDDRFVDREHGQRLIEAYEEGKDADWILLEGWTNLIEGAGFYRSNEWDYPNQYINITRLYADPEPKTLQFQAEGADDFYDTTPNTNTFGDYSKRGLDVKRYEVRNNSGKLTESGLYVDDVKAGEWLEYQNVKLGADTYRFTARVATNGTGKRIELVLPGARIIELPNTNGKFQLVHLGQVSLSKGNHDFRIKFHSNDMKLDWFFMKKGGR